MRIWRRATVATMTVTLVLGGAVVVTAPADAATVQIKLRSAVDKLPVANETRSGYTRTKFKLWVDADEDCQDTRSEVLRAESKAPVTGRCAVVTGKWKSYYDGATWTKASDVDIDHLVPLAEAWDSGAKKWNAATRTAYANDLGDSRTLVAVTDNVNQSKGDRDPAEWMPAKGRCKYVSQWVAVKIRWSLTIDKAEKSALKRVAGSCKNVTLTVTKASVGKAGSVSGAPTVPTPSPKPAPTPIACASGDPACPTPTPTPTPAPTATPVLATPTPTPTPSGNDPRFSTCTAAKSAGYGPYYRGTDPEYYWYEDRDNDGIACE